MSWYKKAQFTDYLEIAHGEEDYFLWVFINGFLEVESKEKGDHITIWPHMQSSHYRGRFDPKNKIVTIINPLAGRPIPNHLVRKLYDRFGDVKMVEFH